MRLRHTLCTLALITLASPAMAEDYIMLKVNDEPISAREVDRQWQQLFPPGGAPAFDTVSEGVRQNFLRGLLTERLLYGEAKKEGVEAKPEVKADIADASRKIVVRHYLNAKTAADISEETVKKAYEKEVAALADAKEIRARHILLSNKKEASEVEDKITAGLDFSKAARDFSKDPATASQGGDLGFITPDAMPEAFSKAAFALQEGEVSEPIESPFGWHLILVEKSRPATVPTFAERRDELHANLQEEALNSYAQQMLDQATIRFYDAKGEEMVFSKKPVKVDPNDPNADTQNRAQ